MRSTLSIYGLYNFDKTIFDNFHLPEGIDKDTLIENLLLECAEFEVLYPNTDLMKFAIGSWSRKELDIWERMVKVLSLEYNPIENYDRIEEFKNTETRDLEVNSFNDGADTTTDKVSAFNDPNFTNREQSEISYGSHNQTLDDGSITLEREGHVHGNIGVTTTQQMIESELKLAKESCVYDYIIKSFKTRFCLLIY